jgi:drug/metabolite transporter (DMT)-like permease
LSRQAELSPPARTLPRAHATGRGKLVGHLAMLLFAALVSGSYSLGAMAAPHIGPAAINAVRFVFGIAVMAAAAAIVLRGNVPAPRAPWRFLVLGMLMAVFFVTMFVSLRLAGPVSTGAVFTLMPLMAAGFGRLFLGEVPRPVVLLSLVLAACGAVWVIFRGDVAALLAFDVGAGEVLFLVGVACHAAYAPLVRRLNRGEPLVAFTLWTLFGTGLWIALYGLGEILATDWTSLPAVVWIAVAYLAVFTTAGTTFLVQFAVLRLPAAKVLAYNYLTPSFVIVYEGLLGHGWTTASVAAGALVTMAALLLLAFSPDS